MTLGRISRITFVSLLVLQALLIALALLYGFADWPTLNIAAGIATGLTLAIFVLAALSLPLSLAALVMAIRKRPAWTRRTFLLFAVALLVFLFATPIATISLLD